MSLKQGNGRKERRNERRIIEREFNAWFDRWPNRPRKPPPNRAASLSQTHSKRQEAYR
jgi:hypothetical protein